MDRPIPKYPPDEREPEGLWYWVRVSTPLIAEMGKWSDPVLVRIEQAEDGVLEVAFRKPGVHVT